MQKFLDIADEYDAFLLDLWGVIHDGTALYDSVPHVLQTLHKQGKQVIFLSNAPRRAAKVAKVLSGFGIAEDSYLSVVTSGEAGYRWLFEHVVEPRNYYFMGSERDIDVMHGLPCTRVHSFEEAEFIVNVGYTTEKGELHLTQEALERLPAAKALGLEMLCLNPDLEVVKITGERFACAGVLARAYEQMGGNVRWFGKPHMTVYDLCFSLLGGVPRAKILAVGDSLETDITGAAKAGIDSTLITGGILRLRTPEEIEAMTKEAGLSPRFVFPQFG